MYTKRLSCMLPGNMHYHAHIDINPRGFLRVYLVESNQVHEAEFEDLRFERHGSIPSVVCCEYAKPPQKDWHVYLSLKDARELINSIVEASEEYEILMRDL
ncbi:hypothetical protein [Photobacterium atrarenae]|uniref:Uncharacterized protein n=1 Tax=Photobacterium atrarenae TaxID=865757 RepID=A0ABY5GHY6_9GAMM|nr:hypothetical protein [Photobacterium atrarenae]UTV28791.1 hypothetical protein NNL38_05985 [Photobacterium atrarenae]